jgi:hypothetical protein
LSAGGSRRLEGTRKGSQSNANWPRVTGDWGGEWDPEVVHVEFGPVQQNNGRFLVHKKVNGQQRGFTIRAEENKVALLAAQAAGIQHVVLPVREQAPKRRGKYAKQSSRAVTRPKKGK